MRKIFLLNIARYFFLYALLWVKKKKKKSKFSKVKKSYKVILPCERKNFNPVCRLSTTQHLKSFCDSDNSSFSQNVSALSFPTLAMCLGVWIISQTAYSDRLLGRRDKLSGSSSL